MKTIGFVFGIFFLLNQGLANTASNSVCQMNTGVPVKVMTFNMQTSASFFQVAPWKSRVQLITQLIRKEKVDVLGAQEIIHSMLGDLSVLLPEYDYVGVGRDDGVSGGEHSPIFYNKNRFDLVATQTFWLSPTPDTPGSIGWDASYPRIVTWAHLKDRHTQNQLMVFNTHFDHLGSRSRREGAKLLVEKSSYLRQGLPAIVMGDFNFKPDTKEYQIIITNSELSDTMKTSPHEGPLWTYSWNGLRKSKIDYVFVSSGLNPCKHRIIPEDPTAQHKRSDHLPIVAELKL